MSWKNSEKKQGSQINIYENELKQCEVFFRYNDCFAVVQWQTCTIYLLLVTGEMPLVIGSLYGSLTTLDDR